MRDRPIASAQRRADNAVAETGYLPLKQGQWLRRDFGWLRRYRNADGHNIQLALSDDELLSPPSEFGLMLQARVAQARRNTVNS